MAITQTVTARLAGNTYPARTLLRASGWTYEADYASWTKQVEARDAWGKADVKALGGFLSGCALVIEDGRRARVVWRDTGVSDRRILRMHVSAGYLIGSEEI